MSNDQAELTLIEGQLGDLLEGIGASDDHKDVLRFLNVECNLREDIAARVHQAIASAEVPINMVLHCPSCGLQHIDKSNQDEVRIEASERGFDHGSRDWEDFIEENEWLNPPHRSHLCAGCKHVWRPSDEYTNGVAAVATRGAADSPIVASRKRIGVGVIDGLGQMLPGVLSEERFVDDRAVHQLDRFFGKSKPHRRVEIWETS